MIYYSPAENIFIARGVEASMVSPNFMSKKIVYQIKTYSPKEGTVKSGVIEKEQFDREIRFRFVLVTDEDTLAKLMMLGLE